MKAISFIKKYKLEFFLIVYQLLFLLVNNPSFSIKNTVILCYLNDFTTGFGPRKLVASLTSLLFGDFVTYNEMRIMILSVCVVLMVLFSIFVGSIFRRVETENKQTYLYLIVLYLSCSFAITFLFQPRTFGRMEAWHILILIIYLLLSRRANSSIKPLLMLIACVLSMIIHHMFLSTFLSAYLFLAIYELRKVDFDKKVLIKYISVFTVVAASFLLLHTIRGNAMPFNETVAYLNSKTNAEVSEHYVKWIYFESIQNHFFQFVIPFLYYNIGSVVLSLFLFFPLYFIIYKGIRKAIALTYNSSNGKTIVYYYLACLPMLISYVTASDFGRWSASHFNCFFLFFLYLLYDDNNTSKELLSSFNSHIKRNMFFYMLLPLYLLLFGKMECKFPEEFISILNIGLSVLGQTPYYF